MILKIIGIKDHQDMDKQRLVLQATDDGNLINYAVVDNTFTTKGELSNKHRHFYSFPDYEVKKGDYVVLYTKQGTDTPQKHGEDQYHYFFWNLEVSVWNEDDTAYLLQMIDSSKKSV